MSSLLRTLLISLCCANACWAGELVVISNVDSGIEKLTRTELINIYMGRNRLLASGASVEPLDLDESRDEKSRFYQDLTGKELAQINSYWARLVFTGQSKPPKQVAQPEAAISFVVAHKYALAYISKKMVTPQVKIIYEFP